VGSGPGNFPNPSLTGNPIAGPQVSLLVKGKTVGARSTDGIGHANGRRTAAIRCKAEYSCPGSVRDKHIADVIQSNASESASEGKCIRRNFSNLHQSGIVDIDFPNRTGSDGGSGDGDRTADV